MIHLLQISNEKNLVKYFDTIFYTISNWIIDTFGVKEYNEDLIYGEVVRK